MNWLVVSILGAFLSAIWTLSMKQGVTSMFPGFTSWTSIIGSVIMTLGLGLSGNKGALQFSKWGAAAGIFQGISSVLMTVSFKDSPNPGLSMAVFRTQSIITAILAFFLFRSKLTVYKILAMLVVVGGVFMVGEGGKKEEAEGFTQEGREVVEENYWVQKLAGKWLLLSVLGGLAMSGKDILTKKAFVSPNKGLPSILWNSIIFQMIILVAWDLYATGTLHVGGKKKTRVTPKRIGIIAWTSVIFLLYITTVITATKLAPNVGYAKAIDTLGIILSTMAAHFMFKSPITKRSMIGIAMILSGVIYVAVA